MKTASTTTTTASTSWRDSFKDVAGMRSFTPFGSLNLSQAECAARVNSCYREIMQNNSRERFLKELVLCITGYGVEDADEPINTSCFSQYTFYDVYIHLKFHRDLFDFLITCVRHKVCMISAIYTSRFMDMVKQLCTPPDYSCVPEWVIKSVADEYELDDIARRNAFYTKRDWEVLTKEQKLVILTQTSDSLPISLLSLLNPTGGGTPTAVKGDPIAQFLF